MSNRIRVNGNGGDHGLMHNAWYDALIDIDVSESKAKAVAKLYAKGVLDNMEISKNFDLLNQKVDNLDDKFTQKFEAVDKRFDKLEADIDKRFEAVDKRFDKLEADIDKRFEAVDKNMDTKLSALKISISAEIKDVANENKLQRKLILGIPAMILAAAFKPEITALIMKLLGG